MVTGLRTFMHLKTYLYVGSILLAFYKNINLYKSRSLMITRKMLMELDYYVIGIIRRCNVYIDQGL